MLCECAHAVVCNHLVSVAVVGGNQSAAAHSKNFIRNLFHAFVYGMNCLNGCIHITRMPNHIAVCKVQNHYVVDTFIQFFQYLFGDRVCAHFRLQIVSSNLRRRDYDTSFTFDGRF